MPPFHAATARTTAPGWSDLRRGSTNISPTLQFLVAEEQLLARDHGVLAAIRIELAKFLQVIPRRSGQRIDETEAPDVMWGTDMTATVTVAEGAAFVFVAVDCGVPSFRSAVSAATQPPCRAVPSPYLVLTKPLRLDIQCQRAASVKIGWKSLDD